MAAGQDLEPYWDVYRQHLRGHVVEWIEKYRIGSISEEEAAANKKVPFGGKYRNKRVLDFLHFLLCFLVHGDFSQLFSLPSHRHV